MYSYSTVNDIGYYKELNKDQNLNEKPIEKLTNEVFKNINLELARNSFQGIQGYFDSLDEGLNFYHSRSDLINLKGFSTVEKLERNPSVYSAITNFKVSVLTPDMVVREAGKDDKSKLLSSFLKFNLDNMQGTIKKSLFNSLTAMINGYSLAEMNFHTKQFNNENKIVLKNIKAKKPGLYGFRLDEFDNIKAIIDLESYTDLPKEKFLHYAFLPSYESPYGFDLFTVLYPLFYAVNELQKLAMLSSSRHATPSLGLFVPTGISNEELESVKSFADDFVSGSVGVLPDQVKADVLDITGRSSNPYQDLLNYFVSKIEQVILLNDLTISQSNKNGTRAETSEKIKHGKFPLVNYIRRDLEEMLKEQLIRPLIALNFDPEEYPLELYPSLLFNDEAEQDKQAYTELISDLTDRGYLDSNLSSNKRFVLTELFGEEATANLLPNQDTNTKEDIDTRDTEEKIEDIQNSEDEIDINYSDNYITVNDDDIQLHSNYDSLDV